MKLVTYVHNGAEKAGALVGKADDRVLDLRAAGGGEPAFASVLALIEAGDRIWDNAKTLAAKAGGDHEVALKDVKLLTPVPNPPQMRDFLCFEEHLLNSFAMLRKTRAAADPDPADALARFERDGLFVPPKIWYEQPLYYKPSRFGIIGTGEDTLWPWFSNKMDYEMEFGCFLGKSGKDVTPEQAKVMIFGYSIYNDMSARDTQAYEMPAGFGPGKGKDFETGNIIGPCIVTADEFDPYKQEMIVRINGKERSRGKSGQMHWKFEQCIAHTSRSERLHPGEFFGSGTVGLGCGLEHGLFLEPNDLIELEVTGIGVLRNRIVRKDPPAGR